MHVDCPGDPVELHVVHVPPGASHGWLKIDFLEAVYEGLARPAGGNRVLCGDLNTPQLELPTGEASAPQLSAYTAELMTALARLLPEEYRGAYSDAAQRS